MGNLARSIMLSLFALSVSPLVSAATIVIGGPANSANCIPWSCQSFFPGNYAQDYLATAFLGPINITDIEFYNTFFNDGPSQSLATMNFSIYLATVASSVPDGTLPGSAVLFDTGALNGSTFPFGGTLTFTGSSYPYNPLNGNLEMYVAVSNNSGGPTPVYFDAALNPNISRWCPACGSAPGYGLVTGFSYQNAQVPEPASLLLMGSGLLALGGLARKRMKKA